MRDSCCAACRLCEKTVIKVLLFSSPNCRVGNQAHSHSGSYPAPATELLLLSAPRKKPPQKVDNTWPSWNTSLTEYNSLFRDIISCMLNMPDLFWISCLTAWHVNVSGRLFAAQTAHKMIGVDGECVVCYLTVNYYVLSARFTSVWSLS